MKKTLVLVVDRDDDFGVKGKVNTPVVGVQNCLDAATAFGIADPEDSDLNALYAAVSVCLELQEEGREADVALICGDEKVGHRSDLALVSQLEAVLDEIKPESVVLVGDGAEDEYIYPIISSRAHVDSVKKVYVKQAPGIEGTFYILTRMLSDPDKRMRFLVPLGFIAVMLSLFFIVPDALVFMMEHDANILSNMSGPFVLLFIGLVFILYGYDITERLHNLRLKIKVSLVGKTTSTIFSFIAFAMIVIVGFYTLSELDDLYMRNTLVKGIYFIATMIWPITLAFAIYQVGEALDLMLNDRILNASTVFSLMGLMSLGLAFTGIMDILMMNIDYGYGLKVGILEIAAGIGVSILSSILKGRMKSHEEGARQDETA